MIDPWVYRAGQTDQLRAVQQEFPFYGTLTLADGRYSHDMLLNHGALVRPELVRATQLADERHLFDFARAEEEPK